TRRPRCVPPPQPPVDTIGYSLVGAWAALTVARAGQIGGGPTSAAAGDGWVGGRFRDTALRCVVRYSDAIYVFHGIWHHVIPGLLPARWLRPSGTAGYLVTAV